MLSALGAGSIIASSSAAQEGAPARPQSFPPVTVTGTHIPRPESEQASPVQVLTSEDLARSGYTTVWQVLNNVPANGQGALSPNFAAAAAAGAAGVSLRGLGVGSTLVLIDGHRVAPYPIGDDDQRSFVDVSSLPLDAIERIEILKDGASAIYGSDAIAGVVNVVLKRSAVGTRITADAGTSYRHDGQQARAALTTGFADASSGRNFFFSAEARKQRQIRYADRGGLFELTDFRANGGYDTTRGVPNALNGNLPESRTGYVTDASGQIVGFMPGCDAGRLASSRCTYANTWSQVQPPAENYSVLGRWTQQLGGSWQLSVEGGLAQAKSEQTHQPSMTAINGFQGIASGPGVPPTLLASLPPTSISSSNPSFPRGTAASAGSLHYTFLDDVGPTVLDSDARSSRVVADLQGQWGPWAVTAAAGQSRVTLRLRQRGVVDPADLQEALDDPTTPYLIGGPNSAQTLARIAPEMSSKDSSRLGFVHVDGVRETFTLPGGPLSVALGADFVRREQHQVSFADAAAGRNDNGNAYAIGTQTTGSLYAEALAPLTRELSVEAALRYDHDNRSGGRSNPKLGLKYAPVAQLAFRGTVSTGFRAPGPAENGTAGSAYSIGPTRDAVLCPDASNPGAPGTFPSQCATSAPTLLASNSALKPETSRSYTLGAVLEPSTGLSLAVDYYLIDLRRQIVIGNTSEVVRGTNLAPIAQVQPDGTTALAVPPVAPIAYYTVRYVNANRTRTSGFDVDVQWRHRFDGVGDLQSDFTLTFMDKYDLTVDGITYKLAGTHGPIVVSGDTGNPRTRIRWVNTLSRGPWSVTATLNHVGSFDLTDPSIGVNDCVTGLGIGAAASAYSNQLGNGVVPSGVSCKVASLTTVDVTGRYAFARNAEFQLSVLNLLNAGAPADWGTYAGNGRAFNPTLHSQAAIGRYFSLRASYTF